MRLWRWIALVRSTGTGFRIFTNLIMRSWIHRVVYALERKLFLGPQRVFGNASGGILEVDRSCTLYNTGFRILRY